MGIFKKLKSTLLYAGLTKEEYRRNEVSFQNANRKILIVMSLLAVIVTSVMFVLSIYVETIEDNKPAYLAGEMMELIILFLTWKAGKERPRRIRFLTYLFSASLYGIGIILGAVVRPNEASVLFVVLCVILPLFFYDRPITTSGITVIAAIAYLVVAKQTKMRYCFREDFADIIAYGFTGIILNAVLMRIKARNQILVAKHEEAEKQLARLNEELTVSNEELLAGNEELIAISDDLQRMLESEKSHTAIIEGLSSIYFGLYFIDVEKDYFEEITSVDEIRELIGKTGVASEGMKIVVEKLIDSAHRPVMRIFHDMSTFQERIRNKTSISQEYVGIIRGWSRAGFIPIERDENGRVTKTIYGLRVIADEKEKIAAQQNLINALAASYRDVYAVNMDTEEAISHRMSKDMMDRYHRPFSKGMYSDNITLYVENEVLEEDRELFAPIRTMEQVKQIFQEKNHYSFNFRILRDGKIHHFQCQLVKPTEKRNEFAIAFKSIEEEKRREAEVQAEIDEQNAIINALSQEYSTIWLIKAEDRRMILYRNTGMEVFQVSISDTTRFGTYDQSRENYIENYILEEDRDRVRTETSYETVQEHIADGGVYSVIFRRIYEGEIIYCQISFARAENKEGVKDFAMGFRNVDVVVREQERQAQLLRDALDAAENANRTKSDFLANMSHDIRTPMNGIIGMTAIAELNLDNKERVQDCLKKITGASKHLLELINEVLDMSKIESGKLELSEDKLNLLEVMDEFLSLIRPQILIHGHKLTVDKANIEHENVIGDSLRIRQVFTNLMSNAIKYTPDGGEIHVTIKERPTNQQKIGCFEFVFEDNGIGISEEFMDDLFEPFARAEDKRVDSVQGTGLGMPISRNIVRMMGGDITVESKLGEGSKFTVIMYLKLQETDKTEQEELPDYAGELGKLNFSSKRVLLVEDNELNAEAAGVLLTMAGLQVDYAKDGIEAVEMVKSSADGYYTMIFMDIKMPCMDGYEATREIRKTDRKYLQEIPIVAMTAHAFADDIQTAKNVGMNEHIAKPIDLSILIELLKKWIK